MSPHGANVSGAPRTRRRTVRIVDAGSSTRTAVVSFLITAAAAMLALAIWLSLRTPDEEPASQRTLPEVILDWRCNAGHTRQLPGQIGPRICEKCGLEMYPSSTWSCENHHRYDVAVRLEIDGEGLPQPVEFRLRGFDWVPRDTVLKCPKCSKPLIERVRDPYDEVVKRRKKRGAQPKRGN